MSIIHFPSSHFNSSGCLARWAIPVKLTAEAPAPCSIEKQGQKIKEH
jgi:hypothetical protein